MVSSNLVALKLNLLDAFAINAIGRPIPIPIKLLAQQLTKPHHRSPHRLSALANARRLTRRSPIGPRAVHSFWLHTPLFYECNDIFHVFDAPL